MKDLSKCKDGEIVKYVPITHPVLQASIKTPDVRTVKWDKRTQELLDNYDAEKFEPLYYCKKCNWIEDGGHRLAMAEIRNRKTVDICVHDNCISKFNWTHSLRGNWKPPWGIMLTEGIFHHKMNKMLSLTPRDYDLLRHSMSKWETLKSLVTWKGKTVIDVGCHVGYMVLQAKSLGAKHSTGVDFRDDVLSVADFVKDANRMPDVEFKTAWLKDFPVASFDIVMCLGVLHKFEPPDYIKHLKQLCGMCRETLVIEMQVLPGNGKYLNVIHEGGFWKTRTQVSPNWLTNQIEGNGFEITSRVVSKQFPYKQTWVARRK